MLATLFLLSHILPLGADPILLQGTILGRSFTITESLLIYWGIAALVGIVAEFVMGWRLPFGIIGAIAASLLGIWLLTNVISLNIAGDIMIAGQSFPIVKAFLGAIIVVILWHALTYPAWRGREHYRRRRNYAYRRDYEY